MTHVPLGEEREVKRLSAIAIDGAPITYIIALASVVTVLAFIPLSVVLASGGSFPLSQGVYPLIGWLLGPLAGAVASATGALVGAFVAPYTTRSLPVSLLGALAGSFAAGTMGATGKRRAWLLPLHIAFGALLALYAGRAVVQNHVTVSAALLGSFIDWSAWLLFFLPTRTLATRWIADAHLSRVAMGLFLGTWIAAGFAHLAGSTVMYALTNWPNAVWLSMTPIAPLEHGARALTGTIIGVGVIAGLRAIGWTKPSASII